MSVRRTPVEEQRIAVIQGVGVLCVLPLAIAALVLWVWWPLILAALVLYGFNSFAQSTTGAVQRCRHDRIKGECYICWHYQIHWP